MKGDPGGCGEVREGMYKTVRQGDASLQYTILPQIDQFYVNEISPVLGTSVTSVPCPPAKDKHCSIRDPSFDLTSVESSYLGLRIIALLVCCGIGIYLFERMGGEICDGNPCRSVPTVDNEIYPTVKNFDEDHVMIKEDFTDSTITTNDDLHFSKIRDDNEASVETIEMSTRGSMTSHENESSNFEFTVDETTLLTTHETSTISFSSTNELSSTISSSMVDSPSTIPEESTNARSSLMIAPTEGIVSLMRKFKILNMPRVTLKLRTNETIPQMYMKSGIASYKNGKITTSVLAQGLSLEGLIFKTPEGTIKPWREKWPFAEDPVVFQRKHHGIVWRDLMFATLIVVIALSVIMALRLSTASRRRQWHNSVEEIIDVEIQDDSSTNLLDVQCREPIDKELSNDTK